MPATTQVLVNTADTLRVNFTVDGTATDPDSLAATVTITKDSDSSTLVPSTAATRVTTGVYSYTLNPQTALDKLTASWAATFSGRATTITTLHEIVGGYYVSLGELRAMPNLNDATKFTVAELVEARQWFETLAEQYCGQAFVPRYKKHRTAGSGTATLLLDPNVRAVRSVRNYSDATTYTEFTETELADIDIDPVGTLTRLTGTWQYGTRNLVIVYEHGYDTCPEDMRQAAKVAIRNHLLEDQTGRTVLSVTNDVGEFVRYSTPGQGRPTGNSEVDTVLNRYRLVAVA